MCVNWAVYIQGFFHRVQYELILLYEKKKNFFDKDWADKHAASDKVSSNKQYEFEEGQDLEEAAIEGFLRP